MEKGITKPINLGSGGGVSIKNVAETIANICGKQIKWDISKPTGDKIRIMDTTRAENFGIKSQFSLEDGIKKQLNGIQNQNLISSRYNSFTEKDLLPSC